MAPRRDLPQHARRSVRLLKQSDSQQPLALPNSSPQRQMTQRKPQEVSQKAAYTGPCYLLDLPLEMRQMIFHWLYGSITVYLRSLPSYGANEISWTNVVEWNNPCPEVLLVSHQLRDEALQVVLQNCVLDLWGIGTYNRSFFQNLPKAANHIKHVAVTFDRLSDIRPNDTSLASLETLFIDSVSEGKEAFLQSFSYHVRDRTAALFAANTRLRSYGVLCDLLDPERQKTRTGRPLKVFLRCKTWDEETIILITDIKKRPRVWKQHIVPKFEYKFSLTTSNSFQLAEVEGEDPETEKSLDEQWLSKTSKHR